MELRDFLWENLTYKQYEELHEQMGITLTRRTQMLNRPESMTLQEVVSLDKIINEGRENRISSVMRLFVDFKCGYDKITPAELDAWGKENAQGCMIFIGAEAVLDLVEG